MEYFATLPADELVRELNHRIDSYYNWVLMTGRLARWRRAYDTYYGQRGAHNSSYVSMQGDKGELSFLMSNEYRNLVQHLLVMTMQSRTSLETVAVNTDSDSKAASFVAKGIVEYYRRDGEIDANTFEAAEISLVMDTGWVFNEWDITRGQDVAVDPDTGRLIRQGDIYSRARTPLDVIIDFTKINRERDWIIVRDPINKYDVAAGLVDDRQKAEDIVGLHRDMAKDALFRFGDVYNIDGFVSTDVDRYTFYHRRTPALPEGRMFQFFTNNIWTYSGPIPYRRLPGNRICPAEMILSAMGYSNTNDLLALQDVMDALISSGVTNMTTCGINNLWSEPTENFDFEQLANGMNHIESDKKPEVLIMNRLAPEWLALTNFIIQRMEAISGVNSVARGNTQGKDFSGAAMALLQSMAIQFNTGLSRSVNKLVEDNGNDIIMLTQDFAQEPRLGMIIGQNNKYMMKSYSGKDLGPIQRVYTRQSNPMKDTTAGKMTILKDFIQMGAVKTPGAYNEVLDTGNLDSAMEPERNDRLTIDTENEALMRGEPVPVVFTDIHPEHLIGHKRLFASPDDRKDPKIIQLAKDHYFEHIKVWGETDPNILAALGIPPLIQPPPLPPGAPAGPGGPGGGPPPAGPPPSGEDQPPKPGGPPGPPSPIVPPGGPPPVNQPGMPANPLSGQEWNPQTGGLNS